MTLCTLRCSLPASVAENSQTNNRRKQGSPSRLQSLLRPAVSECGCKSLPRSPSPSADVPPTTLKRLRRPRSFIVHHDFGCNDWSSCILRENTVYSRGSIGLPHRTTEKPFHVSYIPEKSCSPWVHEDAPEGSGQVRSGLKHLQESLPVSANNDSQMAIPTAGCWKDESLQDQTSGQTSNMDFMKSGLPCRVYSP